MTPGEKMLQRFWLCILLCIGLSCIAYAGDSPDDIVIKDTLNDDTGNGTLIYPTRHDFQSGDLDLTALSIYPDTDGYWFKAEFKNPIRSPAKVTTDSGPEPLSEFARKGFYNFNIDIYIDEDNIIASGNTFTLPGRHATLAAEHAWERAIILTPRPETMRSLLIETLQQQFSSLSPAEIEQKINAQILFADRVQVRGKSISFFVPAQFFNTAASNWSITAFITAAKLQVESTWSPSDEPVDADSLELGVMQPASGRPANQLAYRGSAKPLPIVDILATTTAEQNSMLSHNASLQAGGPGKEKSDHNAIPVTSLAAFIGAPPAVANNVTNNTTGNPLPNPDNVTRRLETLQLLYKDNIITEDEYHQQRQRILNEL